MLAGQIRALLFLFLLLATSPVDGAFTRSAMWRLDAIEKTFSGTCYRPAASMEPVRVCANATLKALLDLHTNNDHGAGISIAYYDLVDGFILGGAGWADWNTVLLPVGVCLSGQVDGLDDTYVTACRFAHADNDHESASAHEQEYIVNRPQLRVTDGCYAPIHHHTWFRLDDSTNGVLTIVGLIIAIPVYSIYRRYCARHAMRQSRMSDGQAVSLVGVGGGTFDDGNRQSASRPKPAHAVI